MTVKQEEIKDILQHIESEFRVNEWELYGMEVWPLIRVRLWYALAYQALETADEDSIAYKSKFSQIKRTLLSPLTWLYHSFKEPSKSFFRIPKGEVFILGDGVSFIKVNDMYYDKFADSLNLLLQKHALKAVRVDSGSTYLSPRYLPSFFIQPALDRIMAWALVLSKFEKPKCDFADYEKVFEYVKKLGLEDQIAKENIRLRSLKVRLMSKYFQRLLSRKSFKAAMSVCYYTDMGFALNLACDHLKIPSYDLQHGVQGDNHGAYGSWANLPKMGYKVIPNYFLSWSAKEKESFDKWTASTKKHQCLVTGNMLASLWSDNRLEQTNLDNQLLNSLTKGRPNILVTLGWDVSDERHIGSTLQVIQQTQYEYNWLIRLHPSMFGEKPIIEKMLADNGISEYELDQSTELPLFTVLKNTDVHVTHSSTSAIEASYFGVKSMITSDYGWALLSDQLESGFAVRALTKETIYDTIQLFISERVESGVVKSYDDTLVSSQIDKLVSTFNS